MPLPNADPSNPALPAPLFADVDAVRGDQLRANNQLIYENFDYLNDGGNLNDATAKNPPVDADTLPLSDSADSGIIKKLTFANLFLWIVTKVYALTGKTTPVDADQFLITDSAASNVGKSLTWANIKATLKTYFDAIYVLIKPQCEWRANTYAGYGSTDTKIPYFANVVTNVDTASAMTVVNNAVNGCKITINTADYYTINFSFNLNSAGWFGLSIDSAQLTTNINSITAANRLATAYATTSVGAQVSIRVYCPVNTVLRPHGEGTAAQTNDTWHFSITRG